MYSSSQNRKEYLTCQHSVVWPSHEIATENIILEGGLLIHGRGQVEARPLCQGRQPSGALGEGSAVTSWPRSGQGAYLGSFFQKLEALFIQDIRRYVKIPERNFSRTLCYCKILAVVMWPHPSGATAGAELYGRQPFRKAVYHLCLLF